MACVSAQTGTLVFAIINFVTAIGWILAGISLLIYCCVNAFTYSPSTNMLPGYKIAIAVFLVLATVNLLFSTFLMNGILKKNSKQIKFYYIFGITKVILSMISLKLMFLFHYSWLYYSYFYCIVFVLNIMYALVLVMIHSTYLKLETVSKQFNHVTLNEEV